MPCRILCHVLAWLVIVGLSACERERRPYQDLTSAAARPNNEPLTSLHAGGAPPTGGGPNPYQQNAWAVGEGKRLFTVFNCTGCHAHGGGAIGPPLMDDEWIYGFAPADIYRTILEGRPNGMPAFRGRIPEYQVWQLVAYVEAMSGQVPLDATSGRSDQMQLRNPETLTPYQSRRQTGHK